MKLILTTLLICSFSLAVEARSKNLDYVRSYFEKDNTRTATVKPRRPTSLPKKKIVKKETKKSITRKVAGKKTKKR